MEEDLEDIQTLKERARENRSSLSVSEREKLRKKVAKIIERQEKEEQKYRRAEMERLYGLGVYA